MSDEQIDYVVGELQRGVDREEIANALRAHGYAEEQVQSLIAEGENRSGGMHIDTSEQNPPIGGAETASATSGEGLPTFKTLITEGFGFMIGRPDLLGWGLVMPLLAMVPIVLGVALTAGVSMFSGESTGVMGLIAVPVMLVAILFTIVISVLNNGALTYAALAQERVKYFDGFGWTWRHFWPFVWVSLLLSLAVMGGFVLLIIPGIIVAIYASFSLFVFIREDKRGLQALERSAELISGNWWAVFGRYFVIGLIFIIPVMLLNGVAESLPQEPSTAGPAIAAFIVALIQMIMQVVMALVMLRVGVLMYRALSSQKSVAAGESKHSLHWVYRILIILGLLLPIVAIVVALIMTQLDTARDQAMEAGQKMSLNSIRVDAELYFFENGESYVGLCEEVVANAGIDEFSSGDTEYECEATTDAFAVEMLLGNGRSYCIDSGGYAGEADYPQRSGAACRN